MALFISGSDLPLASAFTAWVVPSTITGSTTSGTDGVVESEITDASEKADSELRRDEAFCADFLFFWRGVTGRRLSSKDGADDREGFDCGVGVC